MRIEIEIPKEFEEHFNQDKFEDSLNRLYADVHLLAGNYERELAEMLIKAFRESKPAYDIDKVVAELEEMKTIKGSMKTVTCRKWDYGTVNRAIEIVKQGCVSDDVCEWKSDYGFISDKYKRETSCGYTFYDLHNAVPFKYCPYCGKKIKEVE